MIREGGCGNSSWKIKKMVPNSSRGCAPTANASELVVVIQKAAWLLRNPTILPVGSCLSFVPFYHLKLGRSAFNTGSDRFSSRVSLHCQPHEIHSPRRRTLGPTLPVAAYAPHFDNQHLLLTHPLPHLSFYHLTTLPPTTAFYSCYYSCYTAVTTIATTSATTSYLCSTNQAWDFTSKSDT